MKGDGWHRLYLTVAREHIHKPVEDWSPSEWRFARGIVALAKIESAERGSNP